MEGVNKGDSISVTGVLVDYSGLLEIQPVNELINHGSGYTISQSLLTAPIKLVKTANRTYKYRKCSFRKCEPNI